MGIFKVIAAAIIGVLLANILKNAKSELTIMITGGVSILILFYIISGLSGIIDELKILQSYISISGKYISILIKVIGISYITQLAADICRDNGYSAIAGQLEIFCKITIAGLSMPIVIALFEVVTQCVG